MKIFRIILWSAIIIIVITLAVTSYNWHNNIKSGEIAFGGSFSLIDQNGNEITQTAFSKRPTALFFGFTHCPEICPTTLYELDGWLKEVDPSGEKIDAYFVTVDPEKDTVEILDLYISNVTDRIIGITGPLKEVSDMLKKFKIYFEKVPLDANEPDGDYTINHTASIFLLNNGGRFKGTISNGEHSDTAIQKLKNLIKAP